MLARLRRNPALALLALVVLVGVAGVMRATGVGPDGRIKRALGLTRLGCSTSPGSVRNPPGLVGSWVPVAPMPEGSDEIRAVGVGSRVVLGTGIDLAEVGHSFRSHRWMYLFDPAENRYTRLRDAPTRIDHPLLAAHGDDVYLVGSSTASPRGAPGGTRRRRGAGRRSRRCRRRVGRSAAR